MGQTQSVHYEIDINQQPDEVRVVFLDFASYPKWFEHWSWVLDDASKSPSELRPGDKLQCVYMGSSFDCIVVVNSPESFQVRSSFGFIKAHHQMYFKRSTAVKGGTKAVIHENFTGPLAFLLRRGTNSRKNLDYTYEKFTVDLKKRVENGISQSV